VEIGIVVQSNRALVKIGEPAVEPLIQAMGEYVKYVHWRAQRLKNSIGRGSPIDVLAKIGEPAVEH